MLDIKSTPIWNAIEEIIYNSENVDQVEYECTIHTEERDIKVVKLLGMDIIRDYTNKIFDNHVVEVVVGMGDYVKDIYPFRDNLEVTVNEFVLGGAMNQEKLWSNRYKAKLLEADKSVNTDEHRNTHKEDLNTTQTHQFVLQLINRKFEPMITRITSGIYEGIEPESLMRLAVGQELGSLTSQGEPCVSALDIIEPDNKETVSTAIIPANTPLLTIPKLIQRDLGGFYNSGMGSYIQSYNGVFTWWVYPLFATDRWESSQAPKMIIYSAGGQTLESPETSYKITGKTIHVVTETKVLFGDNEQEKGSTYGQGFRTINPKLHMTKPTVIDDDQIEEVILTNHGNSIDVVDHVPPDQVPYSSVVENNPLTINPFTGSSKVLSSIGSRLDIVWKNSRPNSLFPGMLVQFQWMNGDDELLKAEGVLLFAQHQIALDGEGFSAIGHKATTRMTIYVRKQMSAYSDLPEGQ